MTDFTKQQKEIRAGGITGSEIGKLVGVSRFGGPISVYETHVLGINPDKTLAMELGGLVETPICRLYARRTGNRVYRTTTLVAANNPLCRATPDRLVYEQSSSDPIAVLEAKHSSWRDRKNWGDGLDEISEEHVPQVTWEMAAAGLNRADVAVLFDKNEFKIYTVEFNQELFDGMYELAERFWTDHILAKTPPEPDASNQYREFLGHAFPGETSNLIESDADASLLAAGLRDLIMMVKEDEQMVEAKRQQIKLLIGDAAGLVGDWGKITWKKNKDSQKVDWKAAALEMANDLALSSGKPARDILDMLEKKYGITTEGARPFVARWKDDNA